MLRLSRVFLSLLVAVVPVLAQSGLGSITGVVQDSSGGTIAGAAIRLTQTTTQVSRTTAANESGLFTFPSVVAGTYTVTVVRPGFKEKKIENLGVNAFQQVSLGAIMLEVGAPTDSVTVSASAEQALVKDSAVRFATVQAKQVSEMPLAGRNWINLLKVIPGATPTNTNALNGREYTSTGYSDFKINGKSGSQTQVNMDGGSIVDQGSDAKTSVAPSLESIQEVSVLTNNFQAEYGTRGGTVINIVTKSGSNQFHSTLFDYMRNEALNANSWANNFLGTSRPRYRFNYFGANLGGPIKKNKLFFFYNFEDFKQDIPATVALSRTPTDLERQGDFSQTVTNASGQKPVIYTPGTALSGNPIPIPNNILPPSLINPLGKALLAMFPKQNVNNNPLQNYQLQVNNKQPRYANNVKGDWNINDNTRSYIRYTFDGGTQEDRSTGANWGNLEGFTKRPRPDRALAANLTHTFSPSLVMEALYSWNFDQVQWLPADPSGNTKTKYGLSGLPTVFKPANDILPSVANTGYADFAFSRMPAIAINNEHQFSGSLTWIHGSHIIKVGGQHIRNYKDEVDSITDGGDRGTYDFGVSQSIFDTNYSPANVLTGALARFQQVQNIKKKNAIYTDVHVFIQDTWKAKSNLTFDYGIRFYHVPTQHELRPAETLDAVFLPSRWDPAKAPRFYTYDPTNTSAVIDPANPGVKYTGAAATILQWTIVPGSGDPLNGVVALGAPGVGNTGVLNPKPLLFAPRGGFAWSPGGANSKTVLRGGFGWAYNRINISDAINNFENGLTPSVDYRQTSLGTLSASTGLAPITARSFAVRDEAGRKVPTVYDYSLSLQRELPFGMLMDVAYIGNLQRHQSITFNMNAIPLGAAFNPKYIRPGVAGSNFFGPVNAANPGALAGSNTVDNLLMRPYLGFNTLNMLENAGNLMYNSLQVSAGKRFSHGLMFQAAYTLSRLDSGAENVGNYAYNWKDYSGGLAGGDGGDRRHVFTVNYTYDIPSVAKRLHFDNPVGRAVFSDWRMGHLFTFVSGQLTTVSLGSIQQASNTSNVANLSTLYLGTPDLSPRLVLTGDPNAVNRDVAHYFDSSKFALPAVYPAYDGTGERNYIRRPADFANDMTLTKAFKIRESHAFELRAAFYNAFNNVRRQTINTSIQYKANGKTFADGFTLFNTPEALASRNSNLTGTALYNQYRTGIGHTNMTDVNVMRVIEIGLKYRF
jgi:hypothetical protein